MSASGLSQSEERLLAFTESKNCLEKLKAFIRVAHADDLPPLIGIPAELRAIAERRLYSPASPSPPDELLTVEEAALRLGMSKDFLYRHSAQLGARRLGRALRFPSSRLQACVKRSR